MGDRAARSYFLSLNVLNIMMVEVFKVHTHAFMLISVAVVLCNHSFLTFLRCIGKHVHVHDDVLRID